MKEAKEITTPVIDRGENEILRIRSAMILLATAVLGTTVATHALADERSTTGARPGGGVQSDPAGTGFQDQMIERAPWMPPAFNQSTAYTVPKLPKRPVSPASPESIFGHH